MENKEAEVEEEKQKMYVMLWVAVAQFEKGRGSSVAEKREMEMCVYGLRKMEMEEM